MVLADSQRGKVFIATYLCNVFEMYDFIISGILIPYISHLYFPLKNNFSVLLAGSITFMVGFIMRPIGAIFFGHIGDNYGRKRALLLSIFGMTIATLSIGFLPTYEKLSILAPLLLVFLRCIQGFCLGGEGQGANIFVLEHYRGERAGRIGGFLATSNGLAAILGFLISMMVMSSQVPEWGWRICYIFGASLGLIGLYLRFYLPDTPVFDKKKQTPSFFPFFAVFKKRRLNVLSVILCVGVGSTLTYTGFTFINLFLNKFLNYSAQASLAFALGGTVLSMFCVGVGGMVCDKIGSKSLLKFATLFLMVIIFPVHYFLSLGSPLSIWIALALLAISTGGVAGTMPHFIASSFPSEERYTGAAFSNNVAQAIFGGIQPPIALYLIQRTDVLWSPALYTFSLSIIFLIFLVFKKDKIKQFTYY